VIGGTPQYQVWAGARPLERVVCDTILRKGAPLYEEPLTLVRQEQGIRDLMRYFGVLSAIGSGRTRNGQIASLLELPSSNVAVVLERLAALGYVEERRPVMLGSRRRHGFWQISDPFFRFWFRRVAPNRSRLDRGDAIEAAWREIERDLSTYVGRIFEDVCRTWLTRYSEAQAARSAVSIGSWWSRDGSVEIDIACADRDRYTLLGSCKWSRQLVDEHVLEALMRSRDAIEGRAAGAKLALFARKGFTRSLRRRAEGEGVLLVTSDDLFS
jgi:uncharacterized protein